MKSPLELFRNKTLTVVLFGMAMLAFTVLPAVTDPSNMPPALAAIFLACVLGGLGWIVGIRSKKSSEWGLVGVVAGLALGIFAVFAISPQEVVNAATGDINQQELVQLNRLRAAANQFVNLTVRRASENGAQMFRQPPTFGFGHPDHDRDIVVGELLRREADRLGLQVTDESVNDFIRSISQEKVGSSDIREIRTMLGLSETDLYGILKDELKAQTMARFLYGGTTLPPETYWDFYRQMNVQQSVSIVPVSVDAFVDTSAEPSEAELQELFAAHKENYPNGTAKGRLDEGNPGFRQPRKVRLESVEIPFEAVEKTVGEVTDAEIEAFYEEYYKSAPLLEMDGKEGDASQTEGPLLPPMAKDTKKPATKTPKPDKDKPAEKKPAEGETKKPATESPEKPSAKPKPAEPKTETPAKPADKPKEAEPAKETAPPKGEKKESSPPVEEGSKEASEADQESGAALRPRSSLQLVAFFDDGEKADETPEEEPAKQEEAPAKEPAAKEEPTADTPKKEEAAKPEPAKKDAPKADAPKEEKPKAEPAKPKDDAKPKGGAKPTGKKTDDPPKSDTAKPEDMKKEGDAPADGDAAPADGSAPATTPAADSAEPPKPRELDDDLRDEIRDQILRRKTVDRMQELVSETYVYMSEDLAVGATAFKEDKEYLTPEQVSQQLQDFAKKQGLVYDVTPLVSVQDLSQSEEYPIGRAASDTNFQSSRNVAQMVRSSGPTELYRAESVLEIESGSRFVYWKIEDAETYEPESLDSPGIREQVIKTWRELQARKRAMARAGELAKQADGVDKPMSEIFADQTLTGAEDAQTVTVVHPPRFSWLSQASAQMSPNPFNRPAPQLTQLRTVPGMVGEQFMETVVNELQQGEVGVTHSIDMSYYYVVKVDERTYLVKNDDGKLVPSADKQAFRERFTREPVFAPFGFSDYAKLASKELQQYRTNWADELFQRHKVDFTKLDRQRGNDEPEG